MRPVVCDLNHFYSHVRYLVGATPLPNRGSCGSSLSPPQPAHRDTVMAEKLQAIEALGAANSGMKDSYDISTMSRSDDDRKIQTLTLSEVVHTGAALILPASPVPATRGAHPPSGHTTDPRNSFPKQH